MKYFQGDRVVVNDKIGTVAYVTLTQVSVILDDRKDDRGYIGTLYSLEELKLEDKNVRD